MDNVMPQKPSDYKELIVLSLKLYRASFKHVILLSFLLAFAAFVPRLLSIEIGQDIFLNLPILNINRLWLVIVDIICLIFLIAIIWRMHCIMDNTYDAFTKDLKIGVRKVIYVAIAAIIQTLIVVSAVIAIYGLQIVFGLHHVLFNMQVGSIILTGVLFIGQLVLILYLQTLFVFLPPLIAVENKGIFSALMRSVALVWNHWWRVFSVQITPWVAYVILLILVRYVLHIDIHIYFVEQSSHTFAATLLHIVIFALFMPWVAAILLIQLRDLEMRHQLQS